jgi:hypothetical protein
MVQRAPLGGPAAGYGDEAASPARSESALVIAGRSLAKQRLVQTPFDESPADAQDRRKDCIQRRGDPGIFPAALRMSLVGFQQNADSVLILGISAMTATHFGPCSATVSVVTPPVLQRSGAGLFGC